MTELNTFETDHCSSSKFNFYLFNNIDFINFGNSVLVQKSFNVLITALFSKEESSTINLQNIDEEDYKHMDVQYLFDTFIKKL